MIYKYGLINHFEKINSYLTILFDDLEESIVPEQDEDVLIYTKNHKIIRIDIFRLNKYVKIKIRGLITLPNYELIAILNGYLGKYGCLLAIKNNSGFYFARENDKIIVKVKKDTLTACGKFVKEDRMATNYDLDILDNKEPIRVDDWDDTIDKIGQDIFQMEEK